MESGNTTNAVGGNAERVVQARDIYGGVHFWAPGHQSALTPGVPTSLNEVVPRPELSDQAVAELLRDEQQGVVALAGLTGAGGFGKTTLAAAIAEDSRVTERFSDGIAWLTLGEQLHGPELAARINDLAGRITGTQPSYGDPEQAGQHLGAALGDKRYLLVIDDVWRASQLTPFLHGGPSCRRLVTTRNHDALPMTARSVSVDAMTEAQARALLTEGLPAAHARVWDPLLARTGGWPVLLSLANRALHRYVRRQLPIADAIRKIADRLAAKGPTALDVANADQRQLAVEATMEVSLSLLDDAMLDRFLELAVFPEDATIPQQTLEIFWAHTGGLDPDDVEQACLDLADLSLVRGYQLGENPRIWLHDVIGAYLRGRVSDRVAEYHRTLLDAYRAALPIGSPTPWWELPQDEPYLWRHLAYHLSEAGRDEELNAGICDFRWILALLRRGDLVQLESDLSYATDPLAPTLRRAVAQNAHLLTPLGNDSALAPTLLSSLARYPDLADYATKAEQTLSEPHLVRTDPMPDPPHPALRRVIPARGHVIAIGPDSKWLATKDRRTVRLWNTDGTLRTTMTIGQSSVTSSAVSPDGAWLVAGCRDGNVYLWEIDGTPRTTLQAHDAAVKQVVISRDGKWFATTSDDAVRLWNPDGTHKATLDGTTDRLEALAISPDGTWLATTHFDGKVRLWDADGTVKATVDGWIGGSTPIAIAPDASWFATCADGMVELWNSDGTHKKSLVEEDFTRPLGISPNGRWIAVQGIGGIRLLNLDDGTVHAKLATAVPPRDLTISQDGNWLALASRGHPIQLWDAEGTHRATLPGTIETHNVTFSPDGSWLATSSSNGSVWLWSLEDETLAIPPEQSEAVQSVIMSPDGSWFVTLSLRGAMLWNPDGSIRATLDGAAHDTKQIAISSDGSLIATAGRSRVRVWASDGTLRITIKGHRGVVNSLAISPNGAWLAATCSDDTIHVWDAASGAEIATLRTEKPRSIAWFPDSSGFIVGGGPKPYGFRLVL